MRDENPALTVVTFGDFNARSALLWGSGVEHWGWRIFSNFHQII